MNNAIYNISLDVHSTVSQTMVNVPLGDNARTINIVLSNDGIPYDITDDCSARYNILVPSGAVYFGECTITDSVISFDLSNGVTGAVGVAEAEIILVDGNGKQLTSPRFTLRIDNTLHSSEETEAVDSAVLLPQTQRNVPLMNNPSVYRITLNLHETVSKYMLDLKKDDNLRRIEITFADDEDPYILGDAYAAVLRAKKPDGTILYNYCHITEDSKAIYDFTNQTSAAVGITECEVTIYDNANHKLASPTFFLRVANTLYDDNEVESEDEFTALTEAISETNNLDISASKTGNVATVTITHKDGTESSVEIYDGDPFSGDAWDIDYEAHGQHSVIGQPHNVGEALDDIDEYLALSVVHITGEETITGKKTFTNGVEISRPTSGPILKLSSGAGDTNFILERTNGSQCVLESGASVGLFGTKTNHPLQVRTNYINRMTFGTDGSVVLATDVASNSNNNQVATTKWVNSKIPAIPVTSVNGRTGAVTGLAEASDIPTKTSDLVNDSHFVSDTGDATVIWYGSGYHLFDPDDDTQYLTPNKLRAIINDSVHNYVIKDEAGYIYHVMKLFDNGALELEHFHNGAIYRVNWGATSGDTPYGAGVANNHVLGSYSKPSGGIPKTDLAQGVQDSLDLADTALQSFTETDPTVPGWAKAPNKPTYTAAEVGALPDSTVIPVVPANVSAFTNDAGYLVASDLIEATDADVIAIVV